MKLQNKKAVVTGGASGIGKAIAAAFAREGADVAILDLDLDQATQAADQITSSGGGKVTAVRCDVGYADQVGHMYSGMDLSRYY